MNFELMPGGNKYRFAVNDDNLLYCAELPRLKAVEKLELEIRRSLEDPIASPPLAELAKPGMKVAVVVDDGTRPTPQTVLLPVILEHLNKLGIGNDDIIVVIGLGTHRDMTQAEINHRFGAAVAEQVKIVNHDYQNEDGLVNLGVTANGTVVEVNRLVYEADLRILAGTVVPHCYAGWGGGAKMIQPGVCSERTTEGTHVLAGTYPDPLALPGRVTNPIRLEIESVAEKLGPIFIINTVQDIEGRLMGCFAGHYVAAHREAVKLAEQIFVVSIPEPADIVVCGSYPCDNDYWQGFKAFSYARQGVKEGGVMVYAIDGSGGLSGDAPYHTSTLMDWGYRETEDILSALEKGLVQDRIGAAMCVAHSRLRKGIRVISVSTGMSGSDQRALGFEPVPSLAEALLKAYRIMGDQAKVGVVPIGGETIVRVGKNQKTK